MYIPDIISLVHKYFKDKTDKGGEIYVHHLYTVANKAKWLAQSYGFSDKESQMVEQCGLLHDIFEDTSCTEQELIDIGIDQQVIEAIKSVTRQQDEEHYFDFIKRASQNKIGKLVKIADLEHNMDITRLKKFGEYEMKRLQKYWYSWRYLTGYITEDEAMEASGNMK